MIEELLKYQEVDAKLRKIEVELAGSEARKKAASAKKYIDGVEENVNKLNARAEELTHAYNEIAAEQERLSEQKAEFKSAFEHAEDEKAITYLLKKVEDLETKIKRLVSQANKVLSGMQGIIKEYATIKSTTKAAQAQLAENGKKYNELKQSKQAEKDEIEKELKKLEKEVDPVLMEKYKKKRNGKIFPVVYEIRGNVCGACNMEVPMSVMTRVKNGAVVECDNCGKLLYLKK